MKNTRLLLTLELLFLSLMVISLPSIEAPKNIFLVLFVVAALFRQLMNKDLRGWGAWDSLFLAFLGTALLSSFFAGMPHHGEWKGYRVLVTMISVGWLVSRSGYAKRELAWLFGLIVIGAVPPLLFGLWQYLIVHTKPDLQLHSVGHVNHSAIYLTMIFGASLGWSLSLWQSASPIKRLLLATMSLVFFAGIIISDSRGAAGIALLLAVTLILVLAKGRAKFFALSILVGISLLTVFLNASIVQKQLANQNAHNVLSNRDKVWNVSLEAARFSPILGIGMSNWGYIKMEDLKASVEARHQTFDPNKYMLQFGHSHNVYLTALVERGFVGLGITLLLMVAWIRHLIKSFAYTKTSTQAAYLWAGSFSAWLATFGIGFVNTTFHHEHGILACLLLGLYLSYCKTQRV